LLEKFLFGFVLSFHFHFSTSAFFATVEFSINSLDEILFLI